tara:strand:- start:7855 stop:8118 length:264 start_codon:yes stop_codon:yes gene_type:complete
MDRIFLDVRSATEFLDNGLKNSVNIPHTEIIDRLEEINKDKKVLVYCRSGRRSKLATTILISAGFDAEDIGTVQEAKVLAAVEDLLE